MNDYTGKICPYCKTPFKEGDDIVICSVCAMPHHKECWIENQGCTTFGCLGTIMSPEGQTDTQMKTTADVFDFPPEFSAAEDKKLCCPYCGTMNDAKNSFCGGCGRKLEQGAPAAPVQSEPFAGGQQNYSADYSAGYSANDTAGGSAGLFPDSTGYYVSAFSGLKEKKEQVSWNWSAFLFGPFWFLYRKMYIHGVVLLVINFLACLIARFFWPAALSLAGICVCCGLFSNYLYMQDIETKTGSSIPQFPVNDPNARWVKCLSDVDVRAVMAAAGISLAAFLVFGFVLR